MDKVSIATSSGGLWLALVTHFGSALIALVAGTIALVVAKGGRLHKKSGMVFTYGMIVAGILASGIAAYEGNSGSVFGGMILFLATVTLLAAIGDLRMLLGDPLRGPRRLARHLWRMCFGLFIATGSFFIGQMNFVPEPVRFTPLMFALGIAPLPALLYWMWRVRLRRKLSGLVLSPTLSQPG